MVLSLALTSAAPASEGLLIGYTNDTAGYLAALRLERAKKLLAETDLSLGAIAEEVGYGTEAYFCAVFKRAEGVSPGAYRHRLVGDRVTG